MMAGVPGVPGVPGERSDQNFLIMLRAFQRTKPIHVTSYPLYTSYVNNEGTRKATQPLIYMISRPKRISIFLPN